MADASTGSDGRVTLEFSGDASIARGIWSGTQGDLVNLEESFAEFSEDDTAVDIYFSGTFGTVSGTVSASLDGEDLADLSGAQLEVYSDGVKLQ